ncbi:MAG: TolC family protein [Chitinophagaceae bacterium]|nr:TolC family protein [Chitinophagaceae bacterium]
MRTIFIALICFAGPILAQDTTTLTLLQAYDRARKNYPLIKQKDLVSQTAELNISNISKGYLPQFSLNGQASYQSDVTKVNISLPGITIDAPAKDQYKLFAEASQLIYDGGVIKQQKEYQQLNESAQQQQVEVELYKVKESINQLYLGILYLEEQVKQSHLVKADLAIGIKTVEAQVNNGTAFKSNLSALKAEMLKSEQNRIQLKFSIKGMLEALSLFLNQSLPENIKLETPVISYLTLLDKEVQRPELKAFSLQQSVIASQRKLIKAKNLPRSSLFLQGGYGRPALNLLENKFDFYYIGGLKLNWSFGGLYSSKKEKQLVEVNQRMIGVQQDVFLLRTKASLRTQQSEIEKLQQLVATDNDIIELRKTVKDAALARLNEGVITVNDFLQEVNAEDQARQALITHQLQLIQAQINYQTLSGN